MSPSSVTLPAGSLIYAMRILETKVINYLSK